MSGRYALQVMIEPELKERLAEAARDEHRSMSNLVRYVLTSYLENR